MSQLAAGTRVRLAEFVRNPAAVAMLVVLPPVVVETYGAALASFPALPSLGGDPATMGRLTGALFAVAFLAGLVGLFQAVSARAGDERLTLAGFSPRALLAGRLVAVLAIAGVAATVAFAALARTVAVGAPVVALGTLVFAGLLYGLVGVVVGAVLPRELEGSLVLVFLADMDNAFASGIVATDLVVGELFPLYHPHAVFEAAVTEGRLATAHLVPAAAWLAVVLLAAVVAYERTTGSGGGGA